MTISGSGFGAAQGTGQVWLGTANGIIISWSDTQVVAEVALGSASGNARILQNGVMSNSVPFTINTLQISGINPASGPVGTSVTITGTGFGPTQGSGTVLLGNINGLVTSWSDTQIVATVAPGALSGIVLVQQNGQASNALPFTVTNSGSAAAMLVPTVLQMVVGDTHTIQALSATGQPVTGLIWMSSNTNVVSLSTDDPPILANVGLNNPVVPDFQGGLLVQGQTSITKLDGITGQTVSTYTPGLGVLASSNIVPHPDGTVFAVTADNNNPHQAMWVVGIDPASGAQKFSVPLPEPTGGRRVGDYDHAAGAAIIAGDGYFYLPYWYSLTNYPAAGMQGWYLNLLRVKQLQREGLGVRGW